MGAACETSENDPAPGGRCWRIASLLAIAGLWVGMACSRWGAPFFSFCLAGTLTCGIPWLAVWRAEVWTGALGGRCSMRWVSALLGLSIVGWPLLLVGWPLLGLAGMGFVISACSCFCVAALVIQLILNRWLPVLSMASAILHFPILVSLLTPDGF